MSNSYNIDMKNTVQQSQVKALEYEFIRKVNRDIAGRVTPIYNTYLLITASVFAYFIVMEENKCYAKGIKAFGVQYEDSEDITKIFYILANMGMIISLI